jgi:hypothetical protein
MQHETKLPNFVSKCFIHDPSQGERVRLRFTLLFMTVLPALSGFFVQRASAVIKVDLPVSKRFAVAKTVIVGKVSAVDAEHQVVEIATVERLKDNASPATFRLQFVTAPEMIKAIVVGQPVAVMANQKASIHIADTWLVAAPKPEANPPLWRVTQVDTASAGKTFPGTTASLVRVLQEMKAGKATLLDSFEGKVFTAGVKQIAKLDAAKPTFLLHADVNGDGKPDLVIGTPAGVKLFLASGDGFTDATEKWGLKGINASAASAGDVSGSGKVDLLLDGVLYMNDGQKFTATPQDIRLEAGAHVIACTLADLKFGSKVDAGFLLGDGRLLVFHQTSAAWVKEVDRKLLPAGQTPESAVFGEFEEPGKVGLVVASEKSISLFPIKDDEPIADFTRLTGEDLLKMKGFAGGIKNGSITAIDINGDRRPDLFITADGAAMVLINRGFGAFLPDTDAGAELNLAVAKVWPASLGSFRTCAAAKNDAKTPEDLLLVTEEGQVLLAGN